MPHHHQLAARQGTGLRQDGRQLRLGVLRQRGGTWLELHYKTLHTGWLQCQQGTKLLLHRFGGCLGAVHRAGALHSGHGVRLVQLLGTSGPLHLYRRAAAIGIRQERDPTQRSTGCQQCRQRDGQQCFEPQSAHHSTSTIKSVPRTLTVDEGVCTFTFSGCSLPSKPVTMRMVPNSTCTVRLPVWVVASNWKRVMSTCELGPMVICVPSRKNKTAEPWGPVTMRSAAATPPPGTAGRTVSPLATCTLPCTFFSVPLRTSWAQVACPAPSTRLNITALRKPLADRQFFTHNSLNTMQQW